MRLGFTVVACALALAVSGARADKVHDPWTEVGRFVSAPDGDSVKVQTATRGLVSVRVAGIDTPERGQAHWRVARSHLVEQLGSAEVSIACYKTDQYSREVCTVSTKAGDLGASLVGAGLAWHFKRFEGEQTSQQRALYSQLELRARERRMGLWQDPDPMPPDVCRKKRRASEKCH